jgi:dephospho-CoA kinase
MLRLGLTGGIASGKSTVSAMLRKLGFAVLDADSIGHEVIEPGQPAYDEVVREFGASILDAKNHDAKKSVDRSALARSDRSAPARIDSSAPAHIDRSALARIVFADPAKLARLNAIVHPRVEERLNLEFAKLARDGSAPDGSMRDCLARDGSARDRSAGDGSAPAAFVEAALIIEAGLDKKLDGVVVVWCAPAQQIERLVARGFTEEEARRRISAQLPVEEKLRRALEKIDCSGSIAETRRQVEQFATKLRAVRPRV